MQGTGAVLWIIAAAMLIMSVVLLSGRGGGLIAGYNTASAEKKAKYNEAKLCKTMGGGLLVLTINLALCLLYNFEFPYEAMKYAVIAVFAITVIAMLVMGNTVCRTK